MSSLLLLGWLFFMLKAWFDAGAEIDQHDREMERIRRRARAADGAYIRWLAERRDDGPTVSGIELSR